MENLVGFGQAPWEVARCVLVLSSTDMKYDAETQRIITPDQLQRLEKLLGGFKGIFNIISKTYSYAPISSTINPLIEDFDCLVTEIERAHPKGPSTRDIVALQPRSRRS